MLGNAARSGTCRRSPASRKPIARSGGSRWKRRLLDATERLMRDGASFTELSVDRLATEAGISRASFYIYFEDKGHLLRRLASQVFDDLADRRRALVGCGLAARSRRLRAAMARHHRQLSAASTAARRPQRDGRLRPVVGADLSRICWPASPSG